LDNQEAEQDSLGNLFAQTLSVTEAAEVSGFTTGWIRQLLIRGELKGVKIGRDWRVTKSALQEYIEKERRPGPKAE